METKSLQELQSQVEELARLNKEISEIQEHRKARLLECANAVRAAVRPGIHSWNPRIGDSMVFVSLEDSVAFELIIREIKGRRIRAQEGDKPSFYRIDLDLAPEGYQSSELILPSDLYVELKPILAVQFLPTMTERADKLVPMLPTWS